MRICSKIKNELKMKGIKLKMTPNEVKGLCLMTRTYIEGCSANNDLIRWMNGAVLLEFIEGIEKKLPFFRKEVTISIPTACLPLYIAYGNMYREELDPMSLMLSQRVQEAACEAVKADMKAREFYDEYQALIG